MDSDGDEADQGDAEQAREPGSGYDSEESDISMDPELAAEVRAQATEQLVESVFLPPFGSEAQRVLVVRRWLVDGLDALQTSFCICSNSWSQSRVEGTSWFKEQVITVESVRGLAETIGHVMSTSQAANVVCCTMSLLCRQLLALCHSL